MGGWQQFNDRYLKTKRIRVWIDSKSQARFIFDVFKHYMLVCFIGFFFVYMFPFILWFSDNPPEEHRWVLKDFMSVNQSKWPLWIFLLVVFVLYAIVISHKIFGPLKGLRSALDRTKDGAPLKLRLRKGDYHQELFDEIQSTQDRMREDKNILLQRVLSKLEQMDQTGDTQLLVQDIKSHIRVGSNT